MRARMVLLACSLALPTVVGCGRTDLGDYGVQVEDYEVQTTREILLNNDEVVLVELATPTPPSVESALMAVRDGVSIDDLVLTVSPEGDREVFAVADAPVQVYVGGTLRAVIWR